MFHHKADDTEPPRRLVTQDLDVGMLGPRADRTLDEGVFPLSDGFGADRMFQLKDQPGSDGPNNVRRPSLLTHCTAGRASRRAARAARVGRGARARATSRATARRPAVRN